MKRIVTEKMLAKLAKDFRLKARKRKAEVARELNLSEASIHNAEEKPALSLTGVRTRMIEKYSKFKVKGPVYILEER